MTTEPHSDTANKMRLLDRFQPSHEGDLFEQFLAIKQEGTARDYVALFETMAAQLPGLPERVMQGTFIQGLKAELRSSVRLLQPTGLGQAIRLAIMVDENRAWDTGLIGAYPTPPRAGTRVAKPPASGAATTITSQPARETFEPEFRRMSKVEYAEKKAKGLCFKCDGKFTVGHRCPKKCYR